MVKGNGPDGIGAFDLFALAFGTIVGVGWIIVMGEWLGSAGPGGVLLAMGAGALVITCISRCYAVVGPTVAGEGGEFAYARRYFGPGVSFLAGWLLLFVFCAVAAFEAVSVGWLATIIWPALRLDVLAGPGLSEGPGSAVITVAAICVIAFVNARDLQTSVTAQRVMVIALLVLTLAFVGAAVVTGDAGNLRPWFASRPGETSLAGVLSVLAAAPFWFAGFNVVPQASSAQSKAVSVERAAGMMVASVLIAGLFYFAVTLACAVVVPREQLRGVSLPAAAAFELATGSPVFAKVVLLAGLLGLLTTWNAVVFAAGQVIRAMTHARALPAACSGSNAARCGSNSRPILIVSVASALLCGGGKAGLLPIISTVGCSFAVLYLITSLAAVQVTRRDGDGAIAMAWMGVGLSAGLVILGAREAFNGLVGSSPAQWAVMSTWAFAGIIFWLRAARDMRSEGSCRATTS